MMLSKGTIIKTLIKQIHICACYFRVADFSNVVLKANVSSYDDIKQPTLAVARSLKKRLEG